MKQRIFEPNYQSTIALKQGYAQTNMPFGALFDVQNMNIDKKGGKSSRRGYLSLFDLPVQEEVRTLFDFRQISGNQEVISFADTVIYTWDGASVTAMRTGLTQDKPWFFAQYQDRLYGNNGFDDGFVYDGTNQYAFGLSAFLAQIGVATNPNVASTLDGQYQYVVTKYDANRGAESNPQELTGATIVNVGAINTNEVVIGPFQAKLADEQVTHYRLYRLWIKNNAGVTQETQFSRIAELDYATYLGTTFTDTGLPSTTLFVETDTGQEDEGNTPPPLAKFVVEMFGRLFMVPVSDPSLLIYSRPRRPHAYPSGNFFEAGEGDGAPIVRIEKHGKSILVHKTNGLYVLDDDPTQVAQLRRLSGIGTQDIRVSVPDVDNFDYRLTPKGFFRLVPTQFEGSDLREEYLGDDISNDEEVIDWNVTDIATSFFYQKGASRHVYFFFPSSANFETKVLFFDVEIQGWLKYKINTDVYSVTDFQDDNESTMIFGDGYGKVWQWDQGSCDGHEEEPEDANGFVTSATSTTITNADLTAPWTVNVFAGCVFVILDGTGANQKSRVISNTADTLTLQTALAIVPDTTSKYSIGAIDAYADEFWNSHQKQYQNLWKRMRWIVPYVRQTGDFQIEISFRKDFGGSFEFQKVLFNVQNLTSLWGSMIWGVDFWASASTTLKRVRFNGKYHYYSIRYRYREAGNRFFWDGHGAEFQILYDRNK